MNKKTVVLLIAHEGYQPIEFGIPHEILASENINVLVASDQPGVAVAKDSSTTPVDLMIEQINPMQIDGLFLVGGPGALICLDKPQVYALLQQMKALDKPFGAICISTRILAKADVLSGKQATGWNGDKKLEAVFKKHGVTYADQPMVVDGKIITAADPSAAQAFAQAIVRMINA